MKKLLIIFLLLLPTSALATTQIIYGGIPGGTAITNALGANTTVTQGTAGGVIVVGEETATGTISNLVAYSYYSPGSGSWTATLRNGTTNTSLTCNITSSSPVVNGLYQCTDVNPAHNYYMNPGGTMNVNIVANSSPTRSNVYYTYQFTPSTTAQTLVPWSSDDQSIGTAQRYIAPILNVASNGTEANVQAIWPEAGNFSNASTAIQTGATGTWTFGLRDNASNPSPQLLCFIGGVGVTSCSDSTTTQPVSLADLIDWSATPSGSVAATPVAGGFVFTPTISGDFDFYNYSGTGDAAVAIHYFWGQTEEYHRGKHLDGNGYLTGHRNSGLHSHRARDRKDENVLFAAKWGDYDL